MRVGLIIYDSLNTRSGGYFYDRKIVEYLREQGDEVQIISLPWKTYPLHLLQNYSPDLWKQLEKSPLDFLLQDELNHPSLFLLNRRLRARKAYPIISIVHHLRSVEEYPNLLRKVYRMVERSYLRSVDGFIFNSYTTRRSVESLTGKREKSVVAYPAGDRFQKNLGSENLFRRFQEDGPLRLLFVGNIIRRKGLHLLVEALERIKNEPWMLEIAGRAVDNIYCGEIREQVQKAGLNERINFLGEVDDAGMPDIFSKSHVLVAPSFFEGFGIVYLEGMGFGLPSIASSAGGAVEIIEDGVNGYLVDPGDVSRLALLIRTFCRDRQTLHRISMSALQRFQQFPTWEQSAIKARQFLLDWKENKR